MTEETRAIYTEVWKLHKRFYDTKTDTEWESLYEECKKLLVNYPCSFARDLVNAMMGEIESRCKHE